MLASAASGHDAHPGDCLLFTSEALWLGLVVVVLIGAVVARRPTVKPES